MNFDTIKLYVSNREAAERYGVDINRYGKANWPFCSDHRTSLYVSDDGYCCFRCGEETGGRGDGSTSNETAKGR